MTLEVRNAQSRKHGQYQPLAPGGVPHLMFNRRTLMSPDRLHITALHAPVSAVCVFVALPYISAPNNPSPMSCLIIFLISSIYSIML